MASSMLILVAAAIVIAVVAAWAWSRRSLGRPRTLPATSVLGASLRSAKRRALAALAAVVLVMLLGAGLTMARPQDLGLPLAVAPGAAGAVGLLVHAAIPPPSSSTPAERVASLEPRGAWTFVPARTLSALLGILGVSLALLVLSGVTSSGDEQGRRRMFSIAVGEVSASASPYPGWFYAAPLIVVTVVLALACLLALQRISTTASLPGPGLERFDRAWRVVAARIISTLVAATMSLQSGGVALFAGSSMLSVSASVPSTTAAAGGIMLCALGLLALVASVVGYALAALRGASLPAIVIDDALSGRALEVVRGG